MKLFKIRKTNLISNTVFPLLFLLFLFTDGFSQEVKTKNTEKETQLGKLTETTVRAADITPEDEAAIAKEEERKLRLEAELEADEEKAKIRKRTFGSKLFEDTKFDIAQAVNIATPSNYVLGPGDELDVNVWGFSQRRQEAKVSTDGFIVLERGGLINVSGLTIAETESRIKQALTKFYPDINYGRTFVKVSLSGFRTIKVKFTGQVVAPGTYTVTSFTDLINALYVCGGPNEIGTYRNINLIRNNKVYVTLDMYDYLINGFSKDNVLLQDQDVIQVGPYESRVAVEGETKIKGLFETKPGEKLSDLLKYAGGFNQYAYSEIVKIYRNTLSQKEIKSVRKSDFQSEPVFTGDSLVVEKVLDRITNLVSIEGSIYRPGEYSLDANPTLTKLIHSAEGLREESLGGRISIYRTNEDLSISNIGVNYFDILNGKSQDIKLKQFDQIIVPSIFELTEKSYIKIRGAVNNPDAVDGIELPYVKDMTIQDVIVRAGGLTEAASLSRIEIARRKRNIDPKASDAQIAEIIHFKMAPDLSIIDGQESTILMPFDEILVRKSPNYEVQSLVKISGEILYPGSYGLEYKDERISTLISRAGGITDLAFLKGAKLYRKILLSERQLEKREQTMANLNLDRNVKKVEQLEDEDEEVEEKTTTEGVEANFYINDEIGLDFEKILKNPGNPRYDLILMDGDEIVIPKRLETVRIEGEVLYPNSVKFVPGKPFLSYISEGGGFSKKAAKSRSIIVYPNGSVDRTRKFLFVKIYPKIEPGSEIMVPAVTETTADQIGQISNVLTTVSTTLMTVVSIFTLLSLNR